MLKLSVSQPQVPTYDMSDQSSRQRQQATCVPSHPSNTTSQYGLHFYRFILCLIEWLRELRLLCFSVLIQNISKIMQNVLRSLFIWHLGFCRKHLGQIIWNRKCCSEYLQYSKLFLYVCLKIGDYLMAISTFLA